MVDDQSVCDHQIQRTARARRPRALSHAIANHLATPEGDLVSVDHTIPLHFYHQLRIGQPDAVALGRAIEIGVGASRDGKAHFDPLPLCPRMIRSPANSTSSISFSSPGSKRTEVPAGMFKRMPRDATL